jgi:DNA-binding Lrp family transcriptional regulator
MTLEPYQDLADTIGVAPEQVLKMLREWKKDKRIRRLGAIVNHFQMGHGIGAMVVWNVPEEDADQIGQQFASFSRRKRIGLLIYIQWFMRHVPTNLKRPSGI